MIPPTKKKKPKWKKKSAIFQSQKTILLLLPIIKCLKKVVLIICKHTPILKHNNEEIQTCAADIVLMTDFAAMPVGYYIDALVCAPFCSRYHMTIHTGTDAIQNVIQMTNKLIMRSQNQYMKEYLKE